MCRANGVKELVGTTAIVADTPVRLMLSDKTLRLVPDPAQLHPKYLYYFVSSHQARNQIARMASGSSGQNNISQRFIRSLTMSLPSLAEQQRIAEILDSADDQIRLSTNLIAKQKELRIAAIRELAADGLRCFQGLEASELRKPAHRSAGSWSLVPLGSLLTGIDAGHSPDLEDTPAGPGQWGVLKVSAVGENGFRPEENKVAHYEGLHDSAICAHAGDLLMTRANTSQLVGRSCIVGDIPTGLMLSDKILRLRVAERPASTRYVHIVLGLAEVRSQIEIAATGTSNSMKNISQSSVRQLIVPLGSREDVDRIVEIDKLHEERITTLRDEAEALRLLKHGLMDDLLTGRVRVAALYLGVEYAVGGDAVAWAKILWKWSSSSSGFQRSRRRRTDREKAGLAQGELHQKATFRYPCSRSSRTANVGRKATS
jgi:type I restriction enzyme S subunit